MKIKTIFNIDLAVFFSMLFLMIIGVIFIYSSGVTASGMLISNEYIYQIVWIISGLIIFFLVMFYDYLIIQKWALYIYSAFIVILILTLLVGREVHGSRSWLGFFGFGIQPSEFTKIATILFLSDYLVKKNKSIRELSTFITAMFIAFLPVVFIIVQPDLGTSLVYIPIFLVVSLMAGVKKRYIAFLFFSGVQMIFFGMLPAWQKYILKGDVKFVQILITSDLFITLVGSIGIVALLSLIGYLFTKREYFYWIMYSSFLSITGFLGSIVFRSFLK